MATNSKKIQVKDLTMEELLQYEKASNLIMTKYANNARMLKPNSDDALKLQEQFKVNNDIHNKILNEIEEKLKEIA